jgi:MFS transporter, MFS domain-containing protein family, molybdate-anion transporter
VIGFGSSAIFGTFTASLADRFGRKRLVQIYFLVYALNCLCIHNRAIWSIILGRILGGIATSLLFSSFDSWFVCSHEDLSSKYLNDSFAIAGTINAATAILAGLMSQFLVDKIPFHMGGKSDTISVSYGSSLAPFEMSFLILFIGLILVSLIWDRVLHKSDTITTMNTTTTTTTTKSFASELIEGTRIVLQDMNIFLIGIMVSTFEGAMYIWVIIWTPALEGNNDDENKPPLGLIFATFMSAGMLGSQCFALLSKRIRMEIMLALIFSFSFVSLILPAFVINTRIRFLCFFAFEFCVGMWWPASSSFKGKLIKEPTRASVYSVFRVPMNLIVILVLLSSLSLRVTFFVCSALLFSGIVASLMLCHRRRAVSFVKKSTTTTTTTLDPLLSSTV